MDHQQVMGNEQIGNAQFFLQFLEHIDDLRLNGYVQGGNSLVADDKSRICRKSSGDSDSLSLSAGEFMHIPGSVFGIQSDQFHQVQDLLSSLLCICIEFVDIQGFPDDVLDRHAGIQG